MDSTDTLHQILGRLYRSLLQYVGESWPWSPALQATKEWQALQQAIAVQNRGIQRIVDLLLARRAVLSLPQYPHLFTDLHYLAMDHLVREVLQDETSRIVEIERGLQSVGQDEAARAVLAAVLEEERQILNDLRPLSTRPTVGV